MGFDDKQDIDRLSWSTYLNPTSKVWKLESLIFFKMSANLKFYDQDNTLEIGYNEEISLFDIWIEDRGMSPNGLSIKLAIDEAEELCEFIKKRIYSLKGGKTD